MNHTAITTSKLLKLQLTIFILLILNKKTNPLVKLSIALCNEII